VASTTEHETTYVVAPDPTQLAPGVNTATLAILTDDPQRPCAKVSLCARVAYPLTAIPHRLYVRAIDDGPQDISAMWYRRRQMPVGDLDEGD